MSTLVDCLILARTGSSRLPGKVLQDLGGRPILDWVVKSGKESGQFDRIILCSPERNADTMQKYAERHAIESFSGPEDDVLARINLAIKEFGSNNIALLTADNPFVPPSLIADVYRFFVKNGLDYVSTTHMRHSNRWKERPTFPKGISVQVVKAEILLDIERLVSCPKYREHPTLAIYDYYNDRYSIGAFAADKHAKYYEWFAPSINMSIDCEEDMEKARKIVYGLADCLSADTGAIVQKYKESTDA